MKRCDNCKAEILFEDVQFCEHCGATLAPSAASALEDSDDFEVTEATSEKPDRDQRSGRLGQMSEELGVQSSAEVVQSLALSEEEERLLATPNATASGAQDLSAQAQPSASPDAGAVDGMKKLSAEELKSIEKNLYGSASYLTEEEKRNLLKTVHGSSGLEDVQRHKTPKPDLQTDSSAVVPNEPGRPAMAKRGRGIAYYVKNYIQVRGDVELHDNDEIQINDRYYLLRKKRLSPKVIIAGAGTVFALVLIVVGSLFVSGSGSGKGEIVGFVLDDNHQPYIHGASIRLPDLGRTYSSNAQGFFKTDRVPSGSYKIEYVVNGQSLGTDYATVTAGEVTTLSLAPGSPTLAQNQTTVIPEQPAATTSSREPELASAPPPSSAGPESVRPSSERKAELGKITLAASVDGARFSLDGNVLGAGNLTYAKIKPGKHMYVISKDGYGTVGGTVDVAPGETQVLEVALVPTQEESASRPADNLASAQTALKDKNFSEAISLLNTAIGQTPIRAQLYELRAEAYLGQLNKTAARDDYLKAAQLYRGRNENGSAMNNYNMAVKIDAKCITALLERGNLYLARGEEIAAIADFESVVNLDKKSADAFCGLGEARYNQGNYRQAIKYFKDARSIAPDNPLIHQYLMLAYLGDDDFKNVRKSYEKFLEVASQEQKASLQSDKRFDAVLRVMAQEQ